MPRLFTGLWRSPDFLRLWAAQAVSLLGSQITFVALPLTAALALHATPIEMALLQAMQYAPAVLVGLVAGAWVDRLPRRPILVAADAGRALLLLLLPAAALLGLLRMELLVAVAFGVGALGSFFGAAHAAFLPTLTPAERLVEANGKLAASGSVAQIAGSGLAGILVQALTAPVAIAVDALSFLASALLLGSIRAQEPTAPRSRRRPPLWSEIGEGLAVIVRHPLLRALQLSSMTLDIFWNALFAVFFLYVTRDLGLPPAAVGLIFGIGSVGALAGALLARLAADRFGVGPAIIGAQALLGLGTLLIAVSAWLPAAALPLLILAELIGSGTNTV